MDYKTVKWMDVEDMIDAMAESHYQECHAGEDQFPYELDKETYRLLDEQQLLHTFVAESDGKIVGYLVNALSPNHMQFRAKTANHMGWYVKPEYRSQRVGYNLLKLSEPELLKMGVQILYGSHTIHTDCSPLFRRLGWKDLEKSYAKVIGK